MLFGIKKEKNKMSAFRYPNYIIGKERPYTFN
jgi:hypothetical protein